MRQYNTYINLNVSKHFNRHRVGAKIRVEVEVRVEIRLRAKLRLEPQP